MMQKFGWFLKLLGLAGLLPSLCGLVYFGWQSIHLRWLSPPVREHVPLQTSNVLLQVADSAIGMATSADRALSSFTQGIVDGLTIACLVATLLFFGAYRAGMMLMMR